MSLYLEHITQRFGQTLALNDIDLEIRNGEFLAILGPSGCGKTTLLRAIGGFAKPTEGKIRMDDVIYSGNGKMVPVEQRDLGMVFQSFALWPNMTVRQHVEFPMKSPKQKHLTEAQKKEAVDAAIENMGLKPYEDRYPGELSGGQRQRIGIARALAVNPDFIVCDEPISALDVSIQAQVVNLLEELQEKRGLTYLFIAHDLSMVKHISDRIGVMYLGYLVELADSEELFNNPVHPYTKALLSAIPIPEPEIEKNRKRIMLEGTLPSPINLGNECKFASRCPYCTERCKSAQPPLKEIKPGHFVACSEFAK